MTRHIRRTAMVAGVIAITALAFAPGVFAGDYHIAAGLHCSDCHIMHASKDGALINGGTGFAGLLKAGTVNDLCMSCHNGTDVTAPDVATTGTAAAPNDTLGNAYASKYKNSGGYFQGSWATTAHNAAHDVGGGVMVTAVQGTWDSGAGSTGMKCTNCHGPHGTANYRNLAVRPGGITASADVQVRGGESGTQEVYLREAITIPATSTDTAIHYDTDAVAFNDPSNMVDWCISCHTNITTGSKHPQNAPLSGSGADGANWTGGTGPGFGADIGDVDRGVPRVRFAQAGTSYATSGTVGLTNEVFCLSCHKAHGSKYDSSVVWPHFTKSSADRPAACNQCHAKGL